MGSRFAEPEESCARGEDCARAPSGVARQRPHRGLGLATPQSQRQLEPIACAGTGDVYRRDLLGGLLHEYHQAAA
jgi:hypothetical protein